MKNIGIIGIGLIGSSLARDFLAAGDSSLHIYDASAAHMDTAKALHLGHHYHTSAAELAAACDVVFLCVPVRRIGAVATDIAPHLKPGAIITDVGSVKAPVVDALHGVTLPASVHYVPGHPAAGLEYSGPAAGIEGLFKGKAYVLCPDAGANEQAFQAVWDLIGNATGARMCKVDARTHDRIFAFTSHMSHVLAFAAMNATPEISRNAGENILPYTGTSYRDLTRVANANTIMWRDIFLTNTQALEESLDIYIGEITKLRQMITSRDEAGIEAYINSSTALRAYMDKNYGAPGPSVATPPPGEK